jgi:hypothetical protein
MMNTEEKSSEEGRQTWSFMDLAISIGILAIGVNLLSHSFHFGIGASGK